MRNLSHTMLIIFVLIGFTSFCYSQKKEAVPFNERPAIIAGQIKVSEQSNTISITALIINASDAATGMFDLLIIANGEVINKQYLNLSANSSKPITYEWKKPPGGDYLIKVIADPDEKLNEPDRRDNTSEINISYSTGRMEIINKAVKDSSLSASMDLGIENVSVQGHRFQQNKMRVVTINFRVTNNSFSNETKTFRTQIDVASESKFKKTYNVTTNSIAAGQSCYISCTVQNAPHRFTIFIKTDADNSVAESNENNNTAQSFYENPAPPIDRWISAGPDIITGVNNIGYPWPSAVGRLSTIAIHPVSTQIIYVGGQSCGIWKTLDGGANWFPLTDQISVSVAAIALSPLNANRIFWVTAQEGVYRSDDAGLSWTQINMQNLNAVVHNGKLLIHPRDPNIMMVSSRDGIYRSQNGGANWTLVVSGAYATGLEIDRARDVIYCAVANPDNLGVTGIYESFDRGINWRKLHGCPGGRLPTSTNTIRRIGIAVSGSKMYAAFRTTTDFQLYRTTNIGCSIGGVQESSWERAWGTTTDHPSLWGGLWANPLNENNLYLGGTDFWRSTNKGSSFSKVSGYDTPISSAHADHHGFAVLPGQANTIFSLNDGGIYRSTQNGNQGSWTFIGKGIANVEFYDVSDAFTKSELLIGGTQDNGILKTEGSLEWKAKRGGDGATVDIDNSDPNIMYSLGQYATSLQRSVNGGNSWTNMFTGLPGGSACFEMRYHLHPRTKNILLASCTNLWRITNPSDNWAIIFTPTQGVITCSAVEPTADLYLAGTSTGKLFGGISGSNFQQLFSTSSFAKIIDIECDPGNSSTVFLGCDGLSAGRVYMLKKTQTGTYDGSDITGNLPVGVNIQCIAVDRMNSFTIYAGSSKGIYKGTSVNQGQTWQWSAYMEGLPLANIRDLEVHPVSGVLTAATYGRSIFQVSTDHPIGSVLAVEGKINYLRIHDVGTKFGPPNDVLDAEAIVQLDSKPGHYFGLQLRANSTEVANKSSVKLLRAAFESNSPVRIEYSRNGIHSGKIVRVILK